MYNISNTSILGYKKIKKIQAEIAKDREEDGCKIF